jgi:hypothetical protein
MADMRQLAANVDPFLDHLRSLPYINNAQLRGPSGSKDRILDLRTPKGNFSFAMELKRTYLDRTATNALLASAALAGKVPPIVFARYIPRPTGERLAAAGINFVDAAGNLNLHLGNRYQTRLLGQRETRPAPEAQRVGAAAVQVFFTFLASPEAIQSPARRLAERAGVSKTAASDGRQRLVAEGILRQQGARRYLLADADRLEDRFLQGYSRVLRPHLHLARMRGPDRDPGAFVERMAEVAKQEGFQWALTGGAGAYELSRFYRGEEIVVFVPSLTKDLQQKLKLLPDRQGPITFLRMFSPGILGPGSTAHPVAHPWLLYAELLQQEDARALEAAREIRTKYLSK